MAEGSHVCPCGRDFHARFARERYCSNACAAKYGRASFEHAPAQEPIPTAAQSPLGKRLLAAVKDAAARERRRAAAENRVRARDPKRVAGELREMADRVEQRR